MKRYRWTNFYLDSMRAILATPNLPEEVVERERAQLKAFVAERHGAIGLDEKFERWLQLEDLSVCAPVEYLSLLLEIQDAYVQGDAYPALVGACCLGERILNHLLLKTRDYNRSDNRYKKIWRNDSVDDWDFAIQLLVDWRVLRTDEELAFRNLLSLRNPAIHFGAIEERAQRAHEAVRLVHAITDSLFGQSNARFFWAPGEIYVKKEYERDPVTIEFVLPHCVRVGFRHVLDTAVLNGVGRLVARDWDGYEEVEITDLDFRARREAFNEEPTPPPRPTVPGARLGALASTWEWPTDPSDPHAVTSPPE